MAREKRMIKESLFVKNDDDILGDNPIKQRNVMEDRGRNQEDTRQQKFTNHSKERGVPDMNLVDESDMIDLELTGSDISHREGKKANRRFNYVVLLVLILFLTVLGLLWYIGYNYVI